MNAETLKKIIVDQKEEVERIFREEKIIEREFLTTWKSSMESDLIKVVTGVRRTGKSIFSMQLLERKQYAYINFDDERLAGINTEDLNLVLQAFYELYGDIKYVFLDEIQNIDGWELFVNRLHRMGLNIVVTGSNANLLSRELASHLTGRHIPIEIYPFSFREFLDFEGFKIKESLYSTKQKSILIKKLRDYIEWGGFPESVKDRDNAKLYLSTLYSTILSKDIVSRYNLRYVQTLKEIANYLISNFSQPMSYHKLKNIFEMGSTHTAKNYTSYLEETYMVYLLSKFSFKHKEVLASPKKAYVIDTGLINALTFRMSENMGRLMENVVLVELLRKSTELELYYWKDYQQREVDFVVKQGTGIIQLIQVTYADAESEINQRETKALVRASDELKCKNLVCITWDYEEDIQVDNKTIRCVPLWKWLIQQ
ncbi:MAG: ATP-binding protein [Archaeoglobaceae archaeon]